MKFRYAGLKKFYKTQTHIHTANSDGRYSVDDTVARYRDSGFEALCITDHNRVTRMQQRSTRSVCFIDSVELTEETHWRRRSRHIVCLGVDAEFPERGSFARLYALACKRRAVLYLAHPHWSGNSLSQLKRGPFVGQEVFNGVAMYCNNKHVATDVWEEVLSTGRDFYAFAADDFHGGPNPNLATHNLGWIMVAAPRLAPGAVLDAIRAGAFYATNGPTFRALAVRRGKLVIDCSPVQHLFLLGPGCFYQNVNRDAGKPVSHWEFDLAILNEKRHAGLPFLRLEVMDEQGRRAWTNKLFI